jgi:hypothetical protein
MLACFCLRFRTADRIVIAPSLPPMREPHKQSIDQPRRWIHEQLIVWCQEWKHCSDSCGIAKFIDTQFYAVTAVATLIDTRYSLRLPWPLAYTCSPRFCRLIIWRPLWRMYDWMQIVRLSACQTVTIGFLRSWLLGHGNSWRFVDKTDLCIHPETEIKRPIQPATDILSVSGCRRSGADEHRTNKRLQQLITLLDFLCTNIFFFQPRFDQPICDVISGPWALRDQNGFSACSCDLWPFIIRENFDECPQESEAQPMKTDSPMAKFYVTIAAMISCQVWLGTDGIMPSSLSSSHSD